MSNPRCACRRWAFKVTNWEPKDPAEWFRIIQAIQPEEWAKANQKLFAKDCKMAVVGRLMLREAVRQITGGNWSEIRFGRTEKGKPFLLAPAEHQQQRPFSVNISHQGDYVGLAASCSSECGVDIMKVDEPRGRSTEDFLQLLSRQFAPQENKVIQAEKTPRKKLEKFFRFWCLKESYIKAKGIGIHNKLSNLDFHLGASSSDKSEFPTQSTRLIASTDPKAGEYVFTEWELDNDHFFTTGTLNDLPADCACRDTNSPGSDQQTEPIFDYLTQPDLINIDFLLRHSQPLSLSPSASASDSSGGFSDADQQWISLMNKLKK